MVIVVLYSLLMLHTALIVALTRPTIALFLRRRRMILRWSQHLTALDHKRRQPRMVIHSLIRQHHLHPLLTIPPQRRGNRIGIIIGVAALVLLIAGGGIFTLLRPGSRNSPVTASPTVNATATAHVNATATATAAVEDPYTHSGTLTLADPLSDNGKGQGWDVNSNCAFIDGAYHAIAPNPSFGDYCIAGSTDFSNFVFEVQMQVIKGDGGGIDFRDENTATANKYYDFYVWQDGSYELDVVNGGSAKTLSSGSSVAINQSLNQTNVVAVVAQGSLIKLYVNHQLITSATDSTYSHGQIGVEANPFVNNGHPTEVVYSNARVWML